MDTSVLKQAGLTEGESKVYLALLELGPSTSGPIVEHSGVAKSIIYQLLEKLVQKGLASYLTKEKTKYYQASQPDNLLEYVEKRQKDLEESRRKVEELLPKLSAMAMSAKETEVKLFRGFRGMIAVHEHTYQKLARGEEYYEMNIPHNQPEFFHPYWQKDHARRVKTGIKCRLLFDRKTDAKTLKNRNSFTGCDARYMPIEVNAPVWFNGYKDVAAIVVVSSNPITIEITNQEVADAFRTYFEDLWRQSKKFGKN